MRDAGASVPGAREAPRWAGLMGGGWTPPWGRKRSEIRGLGGGGQRGGSGPIASSADPALLLCFEDGEPVFYPDFPRAGQPTRFVVWSAASAAFVQGLPYAAAIGVSDVFAAERTPLLIPYGPFPAAGRPSCPRRARGSARILVRGRGG